MQENIIGDANQNGKGGLRVLAIHRYFWPDTPPYASILRRIAARWAGEGCEVEVLSTQPSYKADAGISKQPKDEEIDGCTVHRMSLLPESAGPVIRALNALLFALRAFIYILMRRKYDVVMISTAPPIIGGALSCLAAKLIGARFIYHCMDVHPEIGKISGEFRNRFVFSVLRMVDIWTCRNSCRVVVLSDDMEVAIKARPHSAGVRVSIINNFGLPVFEEAAVWLPAELRKPEGVFRVIFAGNLGRFQGLETFIDAMRLLRGRQDIEFVFLGTGKAINSLKEMANGMRNVCFLHHQPVAIAQRIIAEADLCVVSLIPGVVRYAYPSKTMAYLQQGRPILVSVEHESALAKMIKAEGVGIVVEPRNANAIANAIVGLADNRDIWSHMQIKAQQCGEELFAEGPILNRWASLIMNMNEEVSRHV